MKSFSQYIGIFAIFSFIFSCSNDFLQEESFIDETTPIVISPNWEANNYSIYCQGVGSSKFTVIQAPSWLVISTPSGQFIDNTTILNCKANTYGDFSEIGIYYSFITLSVEGIGNLAVPVAYITEGNPVVETSTLATLNPNNSYRFLLPINNIGEGILLWYVAQYPDWLTLNTIEDNLVYILPSNGRENFYISYNTNVLLSENTSGKIVLITNDVHNPVVEITVQMDLGTPVLYIRESGTIDFGRTETTRPYSFSNQGNGPLIWKIEGCPEWLTVSESNGITQYYTTTLTFTCNRELLPSGENEVTIYLKTNDKNNPSIPITVTARGNETNPDDIIEIQGNITDACMDKKTDILYLTTNQPNRFIAFDTKTKTIVRELPLQYAPACFSISEAGHKAIIGHGGYISSVDMENFSVSKIVEMDYNIFDIEWGDDDWCCYTPGQEVQHYQLQWMNLDSGITYTTPYWGNNLYGRTLIKKVPQQNYIVASRLNISPTGISVFNTRTQNGVAYFHTSINDFWFSTDGYHLFSSLNYIYRTSSLLNSSGNISSIGQFSPAPYSIHWIDHHAASHNVWILSSSSSNYYYDQQREIIQYDDTDYFRKKTYYYSDYYNNRPVQAQYVFANQAGTELVVIRNATEGNFMWSLEFIPVE